MKNYIKNLFVSSLFLISPGLTAASSGETLIDSYQGTNRSDFNVTSVEKVDNSEHDNLYKLTIDNYGDKFISNDNVYIYEEKYSNNNEYVISNYLGYFHSIYIDDYSNLFFNCLIRPGEIGFIYFECDDDLLQENRTLRFEFLSYKPYKDICYASGPYGTSLVEEKGYKYIAFDFNVTSVVDLTESERENNVIYNFGYLASFNYDGNGYCSFIDSKLENGKFALTLRQDSDKIAELDLEKLTVENVDVLVLPSFIEECINEGHEEEKNSDKTVKTLIVVISAIGAGGIAALIIALIVTNKKKKSY